MENASGSSPRNRHFFQPLLPGFHSHINIPLAFFSKHIEAEPKNGNQMVKLRSDASDRTWEAKMDGRRLTLGWQKFATSHDLRVGDIVIFRHDGDFLFHVTCFGPSCCEIQYDHHDDDVIELSSVEVETDSDSKKIKTTTEGAGTSSDHLSYFNACVTASNLRNDMLILPMEFARCNDLMNRNCEIILLNEDGKPWRLPLGYHQAQGRACIKRGWKSFCYENRLRANDFMTFKLVGNGKTPVLQKCSSSSSTSQCRFLTLTLSPYYLKMCKLCLPMQFVRMNGIQDARKIILVDRYGIKRTVSLTPEDKYGRMRLGKGWREFCEVNGVKRGESFKLELIKEEEDTGTHLLKFCSKVLNSP